MQLWSVLLIGAVVLIALGVLIDIIARKKNLRLDPEDGLKNAGESERIYKENHLQQTINEFNNPNQ